MPGQLFSGTLGLLRPSSAATKEKQEAERREREGDRYDEQAAKKEMERPKIVWFKPTDKRVPLIAIPTEQAPPDFVTNSESYADKLFVACIKRHVSLSPHLHRCCLNVSCTAYQLSSSVRYTRRGAWSDW
jgi:protein SSD1